MCFRVRRFTIYLIGVAAILTTLYHLEPAQANDAVKTKAANKINDPSFEDGSNKWKGSSTFWPDVICDNNCDNNGMQNHARTGQWWAWFGGNEGGENATKLSQNVHFPSGGAGTLSEIALAWQLRRPIVAIDVPGWGQRVAGARLDHRERQPDLPEDRVHRADSAEAAVRLVLELIPKHPRRLGRV